MSPGQAAAWQFVGAVLIVLACGHLLRDTLGYAIRTPEGGFAGDIDHYVYWTRLVTLGGVQDAYKGTWPETYAVYPPVTLYGYQAVGTLYQWLQDPTFNPDVALASTWLRRALKFYALFWHLLAGTAVFFLVRRLANPARAGMAAGLYLVNPAAIFVVAHWGQPDGAHSLFSVLAVGLVVLGQATLGWGAMAFAALAKPQAWAILPLLVVATLRTSGWQGIARGWGLGAVIGTVLLLPFLVTGRLGEFLSLPGVISTVMPVVSANAHNVWSLWFLPQGQDPIFLRDTDPFVAGLSFRTVAGVFVLLQFAFTYWLYWTRRAGLAEAAALGALGWFVFTTQAHENHLFFALPLLSLAWPRRPGLLVPFGVLSLTVLLNMALHDQLLLEEIGLDLAHPLVEQARLANSVLNTGTFVLWAALTALRPTGAEMQHEKPSPGEGGTPSAVGTLHAAMSPQEQEHNDVAPAQSR